MSMNDLLIECQNKVAQLEAELEEVKALFVDAIGDGFFDGYNQAITDSKVLGHDVYSYKEADILRLSEKYESEHRYSKSIADIRAKVLDDLSAELSEIPFVGVSSSFLKERANKIRQAAKDGE